MSVLQLEALIDFLQRHPDLALRSFRTLEDRTVANKLWEECANILNNVPKSKDDEHSTKTAIQWRTFYRDFKCRLLKKVEKRTEKDILSPFEYKMYTNILEGYADVGIHKSINENNNSTYIPPAKIIPRRIESTPNHASLNNRNTLECIAAAAKNQITALETYVQKMKSCVQEQFDECKKMSCVKQHERDKQALSELKIRLRAETNMRNKIQEENVKLRESIENLRKKLVESDNRNKKINETLQNLKSKMEMSTYEMINNLRQRVRDIDSASKLVQNITSTSGIQSGNFLLRKSDVKWDGDKVISKLEDFILMKIDGKALLQKYTPINIKGRILYKISCMYTGWNVEKRNDFYSITEILDQNPTTNCEDNCVELKLDDLIIIRNKSD